MPRREPQSLRAATEVAGPCWGAVAELLGFPTSIVHPYPEEKEKSQQSWQPLIFAHKRLWEKGWEIYGESVLRGLSRSAQRLPRGNHIVRLHPYQVNLFKKNLSDWSQPTERMANEAEKKHDSAIDLGTRLEWTPLKRGGWNIQTRVLKKVSSNRMAFRPAQQALRLILFAIVIGFFPIFAFTIPRINAGTLENSASLWVPLTFSSLFSGFAGFLLFYCVRPVVFDRDLDCFWKGWRKPTNRHIRARLKVCVDFREMAGLQLLSETWKHGKIREHYTSTELNLVLKDGRRIGLVDDHRTSELNQEAKLLAEFLQVPLWNNSFF